MAENRKVTLAWPLERDGVQHKAGSTVSLPSDQAADLVRSGLARNPEAAPVVSVDAAVTAVATPSTKGK